jgi:hypothetical protein
MTENIKSADFIFYKCKLKAVLIKIKSTLIQDY